MKNPKKYALNAPFFVPGIFGNTAMAGCGVGSGAGGSKIKLDEKLEWYKRLQWNYTFS